MGLSGGWHLHGLGGMEDADATHYLPCNPTPKTSGKSGSSTTMAMTLFLHIQPLYPRILADEACMAAMDEDDLVVSIEAFSPPFPKMRNRKEDANCKLPETMITNSKTYPWLRPAWFVMRASTSSCVCDGHWIGCEPARLASQLT